MHLNDELEFGEVHINRGYGKQHQNFHGRLKLRGTDGEMVNTESNNTWIKRLLTLDLNYK